ncbi:sulfurtransferase TusA [Aliamphritea spongicola]|uniref:sulfurtransferase TusA n=1 Tax=Aliamphritea spongicola TaxID=707589 RepID=UPI00196B8879|nr:sulfurtransferase TusA [Aliamphritea spongicola]MBN3564816.1 sulfurtransferase TusA [Aliamphritea spongicola]
MVEVKADHVMDACGLYCPEPVMLLHNKVREMISGEVLQVLATDPSTQRDIPKFCTFLGHELIAQDADDERFFYYIRKGE